MIINPIPVKKISKGETSDIGNEAEEEALIDKKNVGGVITPAYKRHAANMGESTVKPE